MAKYKFQYAGDATGAEQFNAYADALIGQQTREYLPESQVVTDSNSEVEDEFIKGLREYDQEQASVEKEKAFYSRLDRLEAILNERLDGLENSSNVLDWFASDEGEDYFNTLYNTQQASMPQGEGEMPQPNKFAGIFQVEGANLGQPTRLKSSAIGRGQMVRGTRLLMYRKLGITDITAAEAAFKTDPNFEMQVLNAYREDLDKSIPAHIQGRDREYMIAKGWYTGNVNYPDDKVPHPEAGNTMTAGQYARRATGLK